jgi:hypothetical protein
MDGAFLFCPGEGGKEALYLSYPVLEGSSLTI